MTVEEAIRDRIQANVTPAGGTFQLVVPQNHATWPAVRVQLIDQPVMLHLRGKDKALRSRIQTDVFVPETFAGDPYEVASDVATEIDEEISGVAPFADGSSPQELTVLSVRRVDRDVTYEEDRIPRLIRIRQDYIVWHRTL